MNPAGITPELITQASLLNIYVKLTGNNMGHVHQLSVHSCSYRIQQVFSETSASKGKERSTVILWEG